MKTVKKKILPEYYTSVQAGNKTFELRKDEDNINVGDILELKEWNGNNFTGRKIRAAVTYVLRDCKQYGLMDGHCIIGFRLISEVIKMKNP